MKKRVVIITLISLIMVFSLVVPVFAAMPVYTVAATVDKVGGVNQGNEVTFYFSLKNFTGFPATNTTAQGIVPKNGINTFRAVLEYDDSVFYPIAVNAGGGVTTTTSDGNPAMKGLNTWGGVVYNPDDEGVKRLVVESSSFVNTENEFLQITLKVKESAAVGNATVTLKEITASDDVNDLVPGNANGSVSQTVEVIKSVSDATDADLENGFGGYIRIKPDTTVAQFKLFEGKSSFTNFKAESGTVLTDTSLIPTGTTATDGEYSYTLIAVGDLNSDGKLTVTDLSQLKAFQVGTITVFTANQKRAADIKWDAFSSAVDISQLKLMTVNLGDIRVGLWQPSTIKISGNDVSSPATQTCRPVERDNSHVNW